MPDPHALDDLASPNWHEGPITTRTHAGYTVEELRLLISKQQSPSRYVPAAIDILEQNPLAEGDYYPGDLLHAVLGVDVGYWRGHRDQWERVDEIVETLAFAQTRLQESLQAFRARRL